MQYSLILVLLFGTTQTQASGQWPRGSDKHWPVLQIIQWSFSRQRLANKQGCCWLPWQIRGPMVDGHKSTTTTRRMLLGCMDSLSYVHHLCNMNKIVDLMPVKALLHWKIKPGATLRSRLHGFGISYQSGFRFRSVARLADQPRHKSSSRLFHVDFKVRSIPCASALAGE